MPALNGIPSVIAEATGLSRDSAGPAPGANASGPKTGGPNADGRGFVEFVDVEKSYDGRTFAVTRLNLSVARGEFLTL
ncbi:MAG: hypothetical protein E5Y76_06935, partial [Mesorhizobium sp.]